MIVLTLVVGLAVGLVVIGLVVTMVKKGVGDLLVDWAEGICSFFNQ